LTETRFREHMASGMGRSYSLWLLALIIAAILLTYLFHSNIFVLSLIQELAVMILFATAYNLMLGFSGLLSFGHGGLFGIGAYTLALLMVKVKLSALWALMAAPLLTSIAAWGMGWLCLRLTGVYFAFLTLAFSQLIWAVIWKWRSLTGGDDGIIGIELSGAIGSSAGLFLLILIVVIVCAVLIKMLLIDSQFGFALRLIRENPRRARAIGINVRGYQLLVFCASGFFTGIAGALYALHSGGAFVEYASVAKSFEPIWCSLVGGIYTFVGPIVGAALMLGLDHFISRFTESWALFAGAVLIIVVLFAPEGIVRLAECFYRRLFRRVGVEKWA